MASLSQVEAALVQLVAECLALGHEYIPGSTAPSPVAGTRCRVYRGWPKSSTLNADLKDGTTTITVFPVAGSTRRTTKYLPEWHSTPAQTPTLHVSVSGQQVTFSGRGGGVGQIAAIMIEGLGGTKTLYATRVAFSDTGASIAAALGALIPRSTVTSSTVLVPAITGSGIGDFSVGDSEIGGAIGLPPMLNVSATVVSDVRSYLETRRQEQNIWVTIWSQKPHDRDEVSAAVDDGLANLMDQYGRLTYEFGLPDGANAQIRYISSHTDDVPQQDNLWRRDLRYMVEYPTTITEYSPVVIAVGGSLSLSNVDFSTLFGYQLP